MNLDKLTDLAARFHAMDRRPQAHGPWYRIVNAGDRAQLYIYGPIGDDWSTDAVPASAFVRDLGAVTASSIDLHINSPGGLVFDGVAIYAALRNHAATVDVSIDGIAASAASFVAMAGDTISIEKPAKIMVHDAGGMVLGNAQDMRSMADLLDELSDTIAGIYADRAGGSVASWRDVMSRETWFGAEQAVKAGLADRVAGGPKTSAPEDRRSQLIRARARVHLKEG